MFNSDSPQILKNKARLVDLWNRIDSLNEQEWGELYFLCSFFLIQYKTNDIRTYLESLHESADALLGQFFLQKVLEPTTAGSPPCAISHIGAVRSFFYRFLIDQGRTEKRRPQADYQIGQTTGSDLSDENHTNIIEPISDDTSDESIQVLFDTTQHDMDYFITVSKQWITSLTEDEQLLLRCSFEEGVSAMKLASHYGIASYASKAKRLGISKVRGGGNTDSALRQWFVHLNLNPPEDYINEILGLLKILAVVSLECTALEKSLLRHPNKEGHLS